MITELVKKRAAAFDQFKALADKPVLTDEERTDYPVRQQAVRDLDDQITRARAAQDLAASTAQPVEGQDDNHPIVTREHDPYTNEADAVAMGLRTHKGLRAIACLKLYEGAGKNLQAARGLAVEQYGERHPITRAFDPRRTGNARALAVSVGASGGFAVAPDQAGEIIELLRAEAVVRSANPRNMPMPRGTMTLPGQASPSTASYGSENKAITSSQPSLKQIIASYKKLTALVPVSNDMMRYADPAADAFVRDDVVQVTGLREDLAFILGDGTQDTPRGFLSFANGYAASQAGGSAGTFLTSAASTLAVGGNFVTSTANYTLATVAAELGGAVNKLDTANVRDKRRTWFMHPRSFNYLYNVQNSLGVYVYRDELNKGTLLGYPFKKTTQIGTNYWDASSTNKDLSFVFLVEMNEDIILDSMTLELAVSREGTYVDGNGATISAFQSDQSIIRAIAEHDHQLRHDEAVAVIQGVRWAPALA